MKQVIFSTIMIAILSLTAQAETAVTPSQKIDESPAKFTQVTDENYALAETEKIMEGYVQKIAKTTGTDGMGVFMHVREGADPKDKTIMRINFDTIYSWAVVDLTEPATLVMPDIGGRYQTAWIVSQEHYNPIAIVKPGEYKINREDVGSRYAVFIIRTQANVQDPKDMEAAHKAQDGLKLVQKEKGSFKHTHNWDIDEIVKMRTKWQQIAKDEKLNPDTFFGKKGEKTCKQHKAGTAMGWGGFTPEQAVYISYYSNTDKPQTLTLKDVPAKAFWSITVYDKGGFAKTDTYNINSQFAKNNPDGSVTIHFGGDKSADNYMESFEDMTFILRLYQPTKAYLDGDWKRPELEMVNE
jgi:hypothetical protein